MINITKYISDEDSTERTIRLDNYRRLQNVINHDDCKAILLTGGRQVGMTTTIARIIVEVNQLHKGTKFLYLCDRSAQAEELNNKINKIAPFGSATVIRLSTSNLSDITEVTRKIRMGSYDYVFIESFGVKQQVINFKSIIGSINNKLIVCGTPNGNNPKTILYSAKTTFKGFINVVFNNPLPAEKIANIMAVRQDAIPDHRSREEFYYNHILGRFYMEDEIIKVNNIPMPKVVYTLMMQRMVEFENTFGRKLSVAEYIVELIKQDILNNIKK